MQRTAPPTLKGCGLTSRRHTSQCTRYWKKKVKTCDDRRVDGVDKHSKEDVGRDLFSKERAESRWYSAWQSDRVYPVGFLGSTLNFSDGLFTGIDVLYDFKMRIHQIGDAEGR